MITDGSLSRKDDGQHGFTLVETILALVVTTLILGALYGSYSAGLRIWHAGMNRADLYQNARVALDVMSRDLEAAFLSPHNSGTRFLGRDVTDEETGLPRDELSFIAINNDPYLGMSGQSDLTEISYFIDIDPETPERWLQRRQDPTLDRNPLAGGHSSLLGIRVIALDFRYLAGAEKWHEQWNSQSRIPRAVRITLTVEADPEVQRRSQGTDYTLTLGTTVWLRQWYPTRENENGEGNEA